MGGDREDASRRAAAAIAAYELPRKGGAKSSIKIFSDDEEEILVSFCNMAAVTTVAVACSPCRDAPALHPPVTIAIATTKSDSDECVLCMDLRK